jgi:eukaryotic-like serine/threonine-protein kinase
VYAPPSEIVRGYPPELERIVVRALQLDPRQRFPTADKLGTALGEWLAKSGPLLTPAHVAAVVKGRLGPRIEKRREQIRVASAMAPGQGLPSVRPPLSSRPPPDVTPSQGSSVAPRAQTHSGVVPSTSVPAAPVSAREPPMSYLPAPPAPIPIVQLIGPPGPEEPPGLGLRYAIAAGVGVAFAVAVGVSGLLIWRSSHPPQPGVSLSSSVSLSTSPSASTFTSPSPSPFTAASTPPPTIAEGSETATSSPPEITLDLTPDTATVTLDGVALPAGVHAIPRPTSGETSTLVVRAPGYDDRAVGIDAETADSVAVVLERSRKASAAPGSPLPPAGGPAPTKPPAVPGLPENPY